MKKIQRACAECGADISGRGRSAKRCVSCAEVRHRERPPRVRHFCADCEADISSERRWNAKRCVSCANARNRESSRLSERRRHASNPDIAAMKRARQREARNENPERYREYAARYYTKTRDQRVGWQRQYRATNGEHVRELDRQRRAENPEKFREQYCKHRAENLEKALEEERKRYWENPEKAREQQRHYRAENLERYRENDRRRRAENPERWRAKDRNRKARKLNQAGIVRPDIEAYLMELQGSRCAAPDCSKTLKAKPLNFHLDHIHPLALGGLHDDSNLQLLCAPCNMSKGAKPPEAWLMEHSELLRAMPAESDVEIQ